MSNKKSVCRLGLLFPPNPSRGDDGIMVGLCSVGVREQGYASEEFLGSREGGRERFWRDTLETRSLAFGSFDRAPGQTDLCMFSGEGVRVGDEYLGEHPPLIDEVVTH